MSDALGGRCVAVTGGGAGLGRGIALACAREGAAVVVTSRHDDGAGVAELIRARGGDATWVRADVTARRDVEAIVAHACEHHGGLDALVHNATSTRSSEPHRLETADSTLLDEHMAVSLRGAYYCAVAALPALQERRGALVVMTSPAGMEGSAGLPLYGAVKGALRGFAKSLAREWAPSGVRVNVVSPLALSPAMERAVAADPALGERLARRVPLGRVGDPEHDVGPVVAFLVGDGARYVTGQTFVADGGRFLSL